MLALFSKLIANTASFHKDRPIQTASWRGRMGFAALFLVTLTLSFQISAQEGRREFYGWSSYRSSEPASACADNCGFFGGMKSLRAVTLSCGRWEYRCACNNIPGEIVIGPFCKPDSAISAYRAGVWRCAKTEELLPEGLTTDTAACNLNDRKECPVGNPTYPSSGQKVESALDFATEGPAAFEVRRLFTSNIAPIGVDPALGRGWRLSFETHLSKVSSTAIDIQQPNGNVFRFDLSGGTWSLSTNTSYDVKLVGYTSPAEAYEFTDEDDTLQRFEIVAGALRLVSSTQRGGYQTTVAYDTNGKITSVSDNLSRTATFTWTNSVVTRIAAPGSINIDYTYEYKYFDSSSNPIVDSRIVKTVTVTASTGTSETTTYHYENTDWPYALTGITDGRSVRYATFAYDNVSGRVTSSEHSGTVDQHTFSYPAANQTTIVNPLGKSATYNFTSINGALRLTSVAGAASTNCPASGSSLGYNSAGRLNQITDEEGRVTSLVLDSRGMPTSVTRGYGTAAATTTTYTNHSTLRVATQIVEPGRTTNLTWDSNNRLTVLSQVDSTSTSTPYSTNGTTRTWTFTYTGSAGLLASVDGPLSGTGDTIAYTYTTAGFLATVTNEVGQVTTINTVNGRGQPTQITDANSVVTNLTYNNQGRLLTITVNPGGSQAVTTLTYDAIGQITRITRPDSSYFDYAYNNARRLTSITAQNGEKVEYTYNAAGNRTATVIKSSGSTTVFNQTQAFDELMRLLRSIGASSQTAIYGYDKTGSITSHTDPRSKVFSYAFDSVNRLIRETDPEGSQVNYTLDQRDVATTYSDPRSLATTYVYNGFREVIQEVNPDRGTIVYVRDLRGLVTQITDGRGVVVNMTYDNAGRLLTKSYPAATAENITYTYDSVASGNKGVGRLTKIQDQSGSTEFTYDVRGNITADKRTIGGQVYTISYVYDLADRITQITYPSGRIVTYTRDTQGRVTDVTTKKDASSSTVTLVSGVNYQPISGLVQSLYYGNGLNDWHTFTLDYELDVLGVYNGSTAIIQRSHTRTDNLNLTNVWDNVNTSNNMSFWMNDGNRLQNADGPWGSKTFYNDGIGNRTYEITTLSGTTVTDQYGYPSTNNRVSDVNRGGTTIRVFTYDGGGSILTDNRSGTSYVYTYNNRNRLATVTVGGNLRGTYTYNGLEQVSIRVMTNQTPSGTVHSLYDRGGNLLAETNGTASGTTREYIWLPGVEIAPTYRSRAQLDRPVALVDGVNTGSPTTYYVHVDHLQRPIKVTNGSKTSVWDAVWKPWGEVHAITGTLTLDARLPGQWFQIEAGLHYNWHRHYDSTIGRYTQPDPLGFVDGPSLYAFARNLPQQLVDPEGRFVPVLIGVAAGLILEAGADYVERSCGCSTGSSAANYVAGAGTGAILGDIASPLSYPRSGVGGTSASGATSRLSSFLSSISPRMNTNLWAPTPKKPFSTTANFGRFAGRWSVVGAAAYAGYDAYRIVRCLSK